MARGIKTENFDKVQIDSTEDLRTWLLENHQQPHAVWVVTYKKSTPKKYVSQNDILDVILCFGWIDGIRRKVDEHRTMQLIAPRKAQYWAKSYKDRFEKLDEAGLVHASGYASRDTAKQSGLWSFMDDVDALIKPDDLKAALEAFPPATENFDKFAPSAQRFTLRWIKLAKTHTTRQKRISETAKLAAKNEFVPGVRM